MTPQLTWLAFALVLVFVHIFVSAAAKRKQDGLQWAAGPRDNPPTYTGTAARLDRAEKNLHETVWIFAAALLIAHVAGRDGAMNLWGARLYVVARLLFVPLYATGVKNWRSVVFGIGIVGLVLTLMPLL